jgi:hypothetical protein
MYKPMKIIKNERLINRNSKIGNWATLAGLVLVIIPSYFYFQALLQGNNQVPNVTLLFTLTILGVIISQVGMYMGVRYGRSPRPDEKLDAGLKGLPNEFVIYHYKTPVPHLLIGPAGIWILKAYHQRGHLTFKKNRWQMSGGGFAQGYMRIFGQEGLGRPEYEIEGEVQSIQKYLKKQMGNSEIPSINAMLVFTNEAVEIDMEDAPVPALKLKQIKDFFRQKAKEKKLSAQMLNELNSALG